MKQKQWNSIFRKNSLFEATDPKDAFRKKVVEEKEVILEALKWKQQGKDKWFASDNKYDYEITQGRTLVSLDVWNKKMRKAGKDTEGDPKDADQHAYEGGGTFKTVDDAKESAEKGKY